MIYNFLIADFHYTTMFWSLLFSFIIEDAMRRRHRRPRIWGSAVCDLFCELWQIYNPNRDHNSSKNVKKSTPNL